MRLNENLQICLLSLVSRYPTHVLDMNEDVFGPQKLGKDGWKALDIIELLQSTQPEILQEQALLVVDQQECSIYLVNQSEEIPAIWVHCEGELPPYQGSLLERKAKHRRSLLNKFFSSPHSLATIRSK